MRTWNHAVCLYGYVADLVDRTKEYLDKPSLWASDRDRRVVVHWLREIVSVAWYYASGRSHATNQPIRPSIKPAASESLAEFIGTMALRILFVYQSIDERAKLVVYIESKLLDDDIIDSAAIRALEAKWRFVDNAKGSPSDDLRDAFVAVWIAGEEDYALDMLK